MSARAPGQTRHAALHGCPLNLLVAGRRCVVVGAGRIAARKIEALLDAGADVHVVAIELNDEVTAWRDEGRVHDSQRPFEASDVDGAWLAIAATSDPEVNRAVFDAGEARRVWVNAVDDPASCSVTWMSVVRRGDLVVTVGTGGRSPALAAWLKDRLATELGPEYEALLEVLAVARDELRATGRSSEDADWRRALDSGMLDLLRSGHVAEAKELLRTCLSSS